MSLARRLAEGLSGPWGAQVAQAAQGAPAVAAGFVRRALDRAVAGVGPLDGAAVVADRARQEHGDGAVRALVDTHVRLAGAQGLLTSVGGLVTVPVALPANIGGLALVQCRLAAAVAHLRGHDLTDPRVRNAVLVTLLGEEQVEVLIADRGLPGTPMALATAPVHDPDLDLVVANEVAAELLKRVAGKRLAVTLGRRTPLLGGVVGAGADGWATWQLGRYCDRELLPRRSLR